jgi:alpha-galactosidase
MLKLMGAGSIGLTCLLGCGDDKPIDLSTSNLDLVLKAAGQQLALEQYGAHGLSWLHTASASGLFAVHVNGKRFTASNMTYEGFGEEKPARGVRHVMASFNGPGFDVHQHIMVYEDTGLAEMWPVVRNRTASPCRVERVDSFSFDIPEADYKLLSYTSDWGAEFKLEEEILAGRIILESRAGRSSKGQHPWFALVRDGKNVWSGSVVWSGNWIFRFEPLATVSPASQLPLSGFRVSGGLNEWAFSKDILPGESMESPHVVLVLGDNLNSVSQQYARVGRKYWYPQNALSSRLPVEWNHWWVYEDVDINEAVFSQNIDKAAGLGVEVCTLDAGWFGPSEAGTHWYEYRGDWHLVNERRFPGGIRLLSDRTHAKKMSFGLWCEIEGLGVHAQLARDHPDFVASRGGERLGYVCFGNPAAQEWAFQTLSRLITEHNCDWIKLDFNLDPGAGCDRADHGHQAGDGLYEHYRGYYRTLERVRQAFPEVILENCSSGGLRIDLGILRQTYMTYLSDPDWPVHDLTIFWGASTMLAPDVLLHWSFCEWRSPNHPPKQTFNPRDPALTHKQLDYYTRISMLGLYGFSQKLPELPGWVAERLKTHTRLYKDTVRRFVKEADLYRLTDQPKRSGEGERWCAFQYSLPGGSEHLLFVFRLPGAPPERSIMLQNLQPDRLYTITDLEGEFEQQLPGSALMERGLSFTNLEEEDSALLKIS